jgi:hypothetical protein
MIGRDTGVVIYLVRAAFAPLQHRRALYCGLYNASGSSSMVRQFAGAAFSNMR